MSEVKEEASKDSKSEPKSSRSKRKQSGRIATLVAAVVLAALITATSYIYDVSPGAIRQPVMEHYHFRMQLIVDGKPVDFAQQKFQTPLDKGQCSADLPPRPIHFHDRKDQFVHIHWDGMTGGQVLKNYGWNLIGGPSGTLGYRLDALPRIQNVTTFGQVLPALPDGAKFWVYSGDEQTYKKRPIGDFLKQNLEDFFGKRSNFMSHWPVGPKLFGWLFPKAAAHGNEVHAQTNAEETETERLTRINNLIGNVVIFVQSGQPTDQQVKARLADLEPLSDSTCGG